MDGKLFLSTARFLRDKGLDEAAYRSAASRAYYACFLAARQIAFEKCDQGALRMAGIPKVTAIRHEKLQAYLKGSSIDSIQQLGEDLADLHGRRVDADYKMDLTFSSTEAGDAIGDAEAFLEVFSKEDPDEIGRAMARHINQTFGSGSSGSIAQAD